MSFLFKNPNDMSFAFANGMMVKFYAVTSQSEMASFVSLSTFEKLLANIQGEPHLLHPDPISLLQSFSDSLSCVVFAKCGEGYELAAHVRLVHLVKNDDGKDWYELGTTWVSRTCRGIGLNKEMYRYFLSLHKDKNILATTTNRDSLRAGQSLGFTTLGRRFFPLKVWQASCTCGPEKTGEGGPIHCQKAFGEFPKTEDICYFRMVNQS